MYRFPQYIRHVCMLGENGAVLYIHAYMECRRLRYDQALRLLDFAEQQERNNTSGRAIDMRDDES